MQAIYPLDNLDDTRRLAKLIAKEVTGGRHIGLIGPLGAGKTTFVQYLAQELGARERPDSPTFVLRHSYPITASAHQLVHADLYRMPESAPLTKVAELGLLDDWADAETVTVIEWIDRVPALASQSEFQLTFNVDPQTGHRQVQVETRL